jgi:hypothetical protein
VKGVDIDFVARLERKNDNNTISNKTFGFSKKLQLDIQFKRDMKTKEQMKGLLVEGKT